MKDRVKAIIGNFSPIDLFIIVAFINIGLVVVGLFATKGLLLKDLVWDAKHALFCDFKYPQNLAQNLSPYQLGNLDGQYPPLPYLLYYLIWRIIPDVIPNSLVDDWYNLFAVMILCLLTYCVLHCTESIIGVGGNRKRVSSLVCVAFLLSAPFCMAQIKSCNCAFWAVALLMATMCLKDSEYVLNREIALICLAAAAGIKLAPAIFGLLYVKEKRWKEVVRLVLYGLIAFFTPFFCFERGSLIIFIRNAMAVSGQARPRPETIIGVFTEVWDVLGLPIKQGQFVGEIVAYFFLVLVVACVFLTKMDCKNYLLLSSVLVIFLNGSYPYTLQYLIIPIAFLGKECMDDISGNDICCMKDCFSKSDYIFAILLALVMTTYPILRIDWPTATFITNYFWLYLLLIFVLVIKSKDAVHSVCISLKKHK